MLISKLTSFAPCSGGTTVEQVMATCMAPPWPSQRRSGFNSERHTALARMRERQGNLEDVFLRKNRWPWYGSGLLGEIVVFTTTTNTCVDVMMDDMFFSTYILHLRYSNICGTYSNFWMISVEIVWGQQLKSSKFHTSFDSLSWNLKFGSSGGRMGRCR